MNRFSYILLLTSALVSFAFCSCNKDTEFDGEENPTVEIPIPAEGYIYFASGMPKTRGQEIKPGPLTHNFSVLGYRYPSSWAAIRPQAKQNLRISYTDNNGKVVSEQDKDKDNHVGVFGINHASSPNYTNAKPGTQEIQYNNGVHEYTPLQSWQKNLSYAFFAWYPSTLIANGGNADYIGNPYITYTLPDGVDKEARKSMPDVLTACHIDYTKRDGMTVTFKMNHRLAALDIQAQSLITAKALKETYNDVFGDVADDAEVTVDVTSLSMTLNSIYTTAKIPLNDKDADENIEATNADTKTYTGFTGTTGLRNNEIISLVGNDELLILIPQTTSITASLKVEYTIHCHGKSKKLSVDATNPISIAALESGVYHYLLITFTKTGLFVKADKSTSWEREVDVEHSFE